MIGRRYRYQYGGQEYTGTIRGAGGFLGDHVLIAPDHMGVLHEISPADQLELLPPTVWRAARTPEPAAEPEPAPDFGPLFGGPQ